MAYAGVGNFERKFNLHNVKLVGESVSADFMAAERTFTGLLK
jgi:hypothetical protein